MMFSVSFFQRVEQKIREIRYEDCTFEGWDFQDDGSLVIDVSGLDGQPGTDGVSCSANRFFVV